MEDIFNFRNYINQLFNNLRDRKRVIQFLKKSVFFLGLFFLLYWLGSFIPEGFDWVMFFKKGLVSPIWTPWAKPIIDLLAPHGYGLVFALSLIGLSARAYRYKPSPFPIALAVISLPTLWVIFLGNLDGLVLFGMLIMPVGIPLVLMKPQVAAFSVLARKDWFIAAVVWGLLSMAIWGFWPTRMLLVTTPQWKIDWAQDIAIFPWGLIPALPLLWFSRGDQDLLMAAGSLATPHLFPYHFILLMPALARMRWYWMIITWVVSWTPLLTNWLDPWAWHFGNLMSICFWFGIYLNKDHSQRSSWLLFIRKKLDKTTSLNTES